MRNVAKCKLCHDIIESMHRTDYVECKCGEIGIDGGEYELKCFAKNFANFMRVDERGNEILVKVEGCKTIIEPENGYIKPIRPELLDMLDGMITTIEAMPPHAMLQPINHYDLVSALILVSAIFKADD